MRELMEESRRCQSPRQQVGRQALSSHMLFKVLEHFNELIMLVYLLLKHFSPRQAPAVTLKILFHTITAGQEHFSTSHLAEKSARIRFIACGIGYRYFMPPS